MAMASSSSSSSFHERSPSQDEAEENDMIALFLEAEVLSYDESLVPSSSASETSQNDVSEDDLSETKDVTREVKRRCIEIEGHGIGSSSKLSLNDCILSKIPVELFQNILKFLSSEDLSTCCRVCQFFRWVASDEVLWKRLYCLRWGILSDGSSFSKPRGSAWKQLYFERDEADMREFVRNTPSDFREYYVQMQAAKRSQAPLPSQIKDDIWIVDPSVADQVTAWRKTRKLNDKFMSSHCCSGKTCSYHQIGDVFLCEKTGCAHVCDDTCRETVLDPSNDLLVCTVSGRCFDRWLTPAEEESEPGQQQLDNTAGAEEAEPFLGSGRLGRAYWLGYNCIDEHELHEALRC